MEPTAEEIRDWKEQVRLNTLVHEYALDKLRGPVLGMDENAAELVNETVKSHYIRLAEESKELSALFTRLLQERGNLGEGSRLPANLRMRSGMRKIA